MRSPFLPLHLFLDTAMLLAITNVGSEPVGAVCYRDGLLGHMDGTKDKCFGSSHDLNSFPNISAEVSWIVQRQVSKGVCARSKEKGGGRSGRADALRQACPLNDMALSSHKQDN